MNDYSRQKRIEAGFSINEIAIETLIPPSTISVFERGLVALDAARIETLAASIPALRLKRLGQLVLRPSLSEMKAHG